MLGGEQRRGDEHRDLLAVLHRLERGAQRHLGLPEPDVAADEAVHRASAPPCRRLTSSMACAWSGVSSNGNASSISRCQTVSGLRTRSRGSRGAAGTGRRAPGRSRGSRPAPATSCARSRRRPSCAASASRHPCSGARLRPGRWGRRACRRPCTRGAGSRGPRRRWPAAPCRRSAPPRAWRARRSRRLRARRRGRRSVARRAAHGARVGAPSGRPRRRARGAPRGARRRGRAARR